MRHGQRRTDDRNRSGWAAVADHDAGAPVEERRRPQANRASGGPITCGLIASPTAGGYEARPPCPRAVTRLRPARSRDCRPRVWSVHIGSAPGGHAAILAHRLLEVAERLAGGARRSRRCAGEKDTPASSRGAVRRSTPTSGLVGSMVCKRTRNARGAGFRAPLVAGQAVSLAQT